tara:strand:- start:676 stop:1173 length:498 start_codon:yes stop_codon:yes gene_type:complete
MKKIIAILVLGLLLNGCGTTASHMAKGNVKIGMTKDEFCLAVNSFRFSKDPCKGTFMEGFNNEARGLYYPETKMEIMHDLEKEFFFVFGDVNTPYNYDTLKEGDGTLIKILKNFNDAKKFASAKDFAIGDDKIQIAKQACKTKGLEPGTEEFADCSLKKIKELSQ